MVDPLLAAPMIEKDYAFGGVQSQGSESSDSTEKVNLPQGEESTQIAQDTEQKADSKEVGDTTSSASTETSSTPRMTFIEEDDSIHSEPQQPLNGVTNPKTEIPNQGGASDSRKSEMSDEMKDVGSDMASAIILDVWCTHLPSVLAKITSIPIENIELAESQGKIGLGVTAKIKERNQQNKKAFLVPPDQRKMIEKPLKEVLKSRGMGMTPEMGLVIALCISAVTMFMQYRQIKQQNDFMVGEILKVANGKNLV